jgi:hypothetical protein
MLILVNGLLKVEHSGMFRCHIELKTCNGRHYIGIESMTVEHATTNIGDKAATVVNIYASTVDPVSRVTGRPRGRGLGGLMCARALVATNSPD